MNLYEKYGGKVVTFYTSDGDQYTFRWPTEEEARRLRHILREMLNQELGVMAKHVNLTPRR